MDQLEQNQTALREDVDEMRGKLDQLLEAMLVMAKKEENSQAAVNAEKVAPPFGSTSNSQHGVTFNFQNSAFLLGILHHKLKVLFNLV